MIASEKVLQLAQKYETMTSENLSKLVRIKSISGEEEAVNKELTRQLREAGFDEVYIDPLGNAIGRIGSGSRVLAIDAHIDTVDVGNIDNWDRDPFSGAIENGFVFGRGTVDQKGGAAAFVTAGRIIRELGGLGPNLTLLVTGTVMEEDCDGLCWKYIIEESKIRPDVVISTEPTNLAVYRGHRGRMEIAVDFRGVSSHGSAPERGVNAIYPAARTALAIEELHGRLADDAFLGKGSVTISQFSSGSPSLCAVADSAHLHLDRRLTHGETKEIAIEEVKSVLADPAAKVSVLHYDGVAYTGLRYGMEKYYPTWVMPEGHAAVRVGVEVGSALFGEAPKVDKWVFSTNCVTINGIHKIPCIGYGPGNEELAHAPNEKVPVEHLVKASAFYALYALRMSEME